MAIFNRIGDLSKIKNQFKLIGMLTKLGMDKPNEMTSICATVICALATAYSLPKETFKEVLNDMELTTDVPGLTPVEGPDED